MSKKKTIFEQISTKPSPNALKWAEKEISILSNILLWGLWLCRVLSLLQISKLVFRKVATALKKSTKDENAKRVNVPPMFCELYFIAWFIFLLLGYLLDFSGPVVRGFTVYYLFESVVWVLYYTVFRRFFEENYSIYHELEYLTVLILVIPSQALGFANLYSLGFLDMLSGLLGAGSDATPGGVQMLGAMFMAIVISMIISAFPSEMVKSLNKKAKTFIIGCGDVVQNRLYPALLRSESAESVDVYDLEGSQKPIYCKCFPTEDDICKDITQKLDRSGIVWVETPSYAHVGYVEKLLRSKASLIVVEKPIAVSPGDLDRIEALTKDEKTRNRLFFLSYYVLEKALPLYYFEHANTAYAKYLNIADRDVLQNRRALLGALEQVEVDIIEGADSRDWVFDPANGGQKLETFIHNMLIASIFCGYPQDWKDVDFKQSAPQEDICHVSLTARRDNTRIVLNMMKNAPETQQRRGAKLTYTHGAVEADFDAKTLTVHFDQLDLDTGLCVKQEYIDKYHIVVDLAKRVSQGSCDAEDVDGLRNQIPVIRWLLEQQ